MPRKGRLVLPDVPHYISQSGHNNQQVFTCNDDYEYYLDTLWEWSEELNCKINAYCLLDNQIHIIINPGHIPENLSKLMKRLAGRQTRYTNSLYNRSGSLWDGRYKSSPIEQGKYLITCIRYIESIPVRNKISSSNEVYSWSSDNQMLREDLGLVFSGFKQKKVRKQEHSFELISKVQEEIIQAAVRSGYPIGGEVFKQNIEEKLGVPIKLNRSGRPKKESEDKNYAAC